jgi:antitoxin ParD1/3/4
MDLKLNPDSERWLQEQVKAGRYPSASEAVGLALRLLRETDELDEPDAEELRALVAEGLASGEPIDGEVIFRELRELVAA